MQFPFQFRTNAEFDVVGFGTNAVDHLITVPEYPQYDSKVEISGYERSAGGEVASTLVGLQRLGLRTAYAGHFGDDEGGSFGLDSLISDNVDVRFAVRIPGAPTQLGFIIIDRRTGERTVLWQRDERLAYTSGDAPVKAAALAKVLHMTPHDVEACIIMARSARKNGVIVSLDIDNAFDGVEELLRYVDVLTAAPRLLEELTGTAEDTESLRFINGRYGCAVAAVTLGARGSVALCGGEMINTGAFAVPGGCVDTTGAGDAFRTGLLYGILTGHSVEKSAEFANAVAALKCRRAGARDGLPDRQELATFMNSYSREDPHIA
jgi:sulfofructose kinase